MESPTCEANFGSKLTCEGLPSLALGGENEFDSPLGAAPNVVAL